MNIEMRPGLTRAQSLFMALIGAEDDMAEAVKCVAAGTMASGGLAEFQRRIDHLKSL